jgi:hypothetical protein
MRAGRRSPGRNELGKYSSLTLARARDLDRWDPIAANAPSERGLGVVDDYAVVGMARGGAVRNRSEIVTVSTPRGPVEVVRQEMQGLEQRRSWTWFWLARRKGKTDWSEASTAVEAIRRATLVGPGKPPSWLNDVGGQAERALAAPADGADA